MVYPESDSASGKTGSDAPPPVATTAATASTPPAAPPMPLPHHLSSHQSTSSRGEEEPDSEPSIIDRIQGPSNELDSRELFEFKEDVNKEAASIAAELSPETDGLDESEAAAWVLREETDEAAGLIRSALSLRLQYCDIIGHSFPRVVRRFLRRTAATVAASDAATAAKTAATAAAAASPPTASGGSSPDQQVTPPPSTQPGGGGESDISSEDDEDNQGRNKLLSDLGSLSRPSYLSLS
jgi:hypothetical protein